MSNLRRACALALAAVISTAPLTAYPLDLAERFGIQRLLGDRALQEQPGGPKLPPGALLGGEEIRLHLTESNPGWDLDGVEKDAALQAALSSMFSQRDPSYAVAVVDITDPENIAWAGLRENNTQLPGSVGKVLCLIALMDGLRRNYPEVADRERVLRERFMVASDWALGDSHSVPKYDPATGRNRSSAVALGDRFSLAEWIDHMISASANSAGAMVWKEAMLLRRFGPTYPPTAEQEQAFFRDTPRAALTALSQIVIDEPLDAAGIDRSKLRQGTFWTRVGQARIPGVQSFASPKELVRVLLRIEQGRMVDAWSSREMKRFLYMTKKRYRYVYAPELAESAVYFKSGSFYQCREEDGFSCGKYKGNAQNIMNSVAIVESPATPGESQKRYLVALLSNVLKVNSAWDHSRIGAAIDTLVRTRRPAEVIESGSEKDKLDVGRSDYGQ